jgi:hypothetical protein
MRRVDAPATQFAQARPLSQQVACPLLLVVLVVVPVYDVYMWCYVLKCGCELEDMDEGGFAKGMKFCNSSAHHPFFLSLSSSQSHYQPHNPPLLHPTHHRQG